MFSWWEYKNGYKGPDDPYLRILRMLEGTVSLDTANVFALSAANNILGAVYEEDKWWTQLQAKSLTPEILLILTQMAETSSLVQTGSTDASFDDFCRKFYYHRGL